LTGHESAQAQVLHINRVRVLISYTTTVALLNSDGWLEITGLYSNTTRRHIRWFLNEYCKNDLGIPPTFETIKLCVRDHMRLNIYTGVVKHY
jgi:hypothetical protein